MPVSPGSALAPAGDTPQSLNAHGVRALAAGDAAAARPLFARAVVLDPQAAALWLNLAKADRLLRDDAAERASLDRALTIDPRDLMGLIRSAELHQRRGELPQAVAAWSGAIAVAPPPGERAPALAELLTAAEAFVAARNADFAAAIDAALAPHRLAVGSGHGDLRRFDVAVDAAVGRRRIYANDCAGLHFPFLPADEFFARDHFPWLAELEAETPAIRAELDALLAGDGAGIVPYVDMVAGAPPNKWSGLDRSLDWSAYYLWRDGAPVGDAAARCPATAAALARIPQANLPRRAPTAFFSILRPRTRIPPHGGVTNTRATVHLPLIVPPGCGFRVGGETRAWRVGEAFAFDDTIEHEAWNDSDALRAVLILDVWNPYLTATEQTLLQRFYAAADASGHDPRG